jgi:hypothetical protein
MTTTEDVVTSASSNASEASRIVELDPALEPFAPLLKMDVPVAIQLNMPLIGLEVVMATKEESHCVTTYAPATPEGFGIPTPAQLRGPAPTYAPTGQLKMDQVVIGYLKADETGKRLILKRRTELGAMVETMFEPAMVAFVSVISEVPPTEKVEQSRIITTN